MRHPSIFCCLSGTLSRDELNFLSSAASSTSFGKTPRHSQPREMISPESLGSAVKPPLHGTFPNHLAWTASSNQMTGLS